VTHAALFSGGKKTESIFDGDEKTFWLILATFSNIGHVFPNIVNSKNRKKFEIFNFISASFVTPAALFSGGKKTESIFDGDEKTFWLILATFSNIGHVFLNIPNRKNRKKFKIFNFNRTSLVTHTALFSGGKTRSQFLMEMNNFLATFSNIGHVFSTLQIVKIEKSLRFSISSVLLL
jgi:hypothetical protein